MERNEENGWVDERLASLRTEGEWEPKVVRGLALLAARRQAERGRGKKYAWLTAAAIATGVPLVAMPATRAFAKRCVSACVNQSSWVGELLNANLPAPSNAYIEAEGRKMAPDFTLKDASGNAVTLSSLRGHVVLLNFWATWCAPCKVEIPWFVEMQEARGKDGLEVLGVSLDDDGWDSVKPYVEAKGINYRVVIGNDDVTRLFGGVASLPTTMVIDRAGRIAAVHVGLCSRREYEDDVSTALKER